jgi:hypothetical protein
MLEEGAMRRMEWNQARTLVLGLGVAVALPAAAAAHHQPGHQGGPDPAGNLSIDATGPVTWARSTVVTGKLTATNQSSGVSVDLEADPYPFEDSGFSRVASGTTDSNGDYRLLDKPSSHTRYRVVAKTSPPTTSAPETVLVRIRVKFTVSTTKPTAGSLVRFSGTACPEHDGKLAYIQRRSSSGSYRTVARARLKDTGEACSEYARRIRVRSGGVYRVKVPSRDADHSTGTSRRIRVSAR